MIRTQDLTPSIYYKESRDFQLFGRLYDIVFNYVKTNVDLMENFPINAHTDSKLIELLARTLGFNNKLNYRNDDLNAICNVFISLIRLVFRSSIPFLIITGLLFSFLIAFTCFRFKILFVYSIISGDERYVFNNSKYFVSPLKMSFNSSNDSYA